MNKRCETCGWVGDESELVDDVGSGFDQALVLLGTEAIDEDDYYRCPDCYSEDVVDTDEEA